LITDGLLATIQDLWHLPRMRNTVHTSSLASLLTGASAASSLEI
jgi:hypothetical protein